MDRLQHLEEKLPIATPHDEGDTLKHSQPVNNKVNMSIMRINTSIMHFNASPQNSVPLRIACPKCNKTFGSAENLRVHARIHTGRQPFFCTQCNKQYTAMSSLNCHERTHSNDRQFVCVICDQAFVRQSSLLKHQLVHNDERLYACEHCDKRFKCKGSLNKHKKDRCRKLLPVLTQQEVRADERDVSQTLPGLTYVYVEFTTFDSFSN